MKVTASKIKDDRLENILEALKSSIKDLEIVLAWIQTSSENLNLCKSAATNYLHLLGITCGGWVLADSALLAVEQLNQKSSEEIFYGSKIVSANYFALHTMPETRSLKEKVIAGSELITEINLETFA